MGIDGAIAGALVGIVLALIKVIDRMTNRKGFNFGEADRGRISVISEMLTKTDERGMPLIYSGAVRLQELEKQTEVMSRLESVINRQSEFVERRINVCEGHTGILKKIEAKL